jgi:hypothetical protein
MAWLHTTNQGGKITEGSVALAARGKNQEKESSEWVGNTCQARYGKSIFGWWKTGRPDYCGNSRYQIHEGIRRRTQVLRIVKQRFQLQTAATPIQVWICLWTDLESLMQVAKRQISFWFQIYVPLSHFWINEYILWYSVEFNGWRNGPTQGHTLLFHCPLSLSLSLSDKHELSLQTSPTCVHVLKSVKRHAAFIELQLWSASI